MSSTCRSIAIATWRCSASRPELLHAEALDGAALDVHALGGQLAVELVGEHLRLAAVEAGRAVLIQLAVLGAVAARGAQPRTALARTLAVRAGRLVHHVVDSGGDRTQRQQERDALE